MRSTVLLGAIETKGAGDSVFQFHGGGVKRGSSSAVFGGAEDLVVESLTGGVDGRQMFRRPLQESVDRLPDGLAQRVMQYSTETGRVLSMRRSTMPFRSSRRSVLVSDFCDTVGMARRSSLNRDGASHSSFNTLRDHLSRTCPSNSRDAASILRSWSATGAGSACSGGWEARAGGYRA